MNRSDHLVLVTGGTGFLGSRLVSQLAMRGSRVRVLARSPGPATASAGQGEIEFVRGDVADRAVVDRAVAGVTLVFHLAAEKSVQRCEREPSRAVSTNVVGSWNVLHAARSAGVERIVAASSANACEPTGTLGLTKSLMERLFSETNDGPACTAVRLGGVLRSTGSVLDRWAEIRAGGFIDLTDPEMTRFVIKAEDSIALLLAASERPSPAEILAPALFAYRLGDLAEAYAKRHRVRISTVGRGPGERTHELLVTAAEVPFTRREGDLFVVARGRGEGGAGPYSSRDAPRLDPKTLDEWVEEERALA